jgi:two-component system alkaline phosphatase synthesis response regulator PhoP
MPAKITRKAQTLSEPGRQHSVDSNDLLDIQGPYCFLRSKGMAPKILIVDDDQDVILFLSTLLSDHGYDTIDASNGREGLEKAKSECPDLILLDLMMPQKSGISMLADLKEDAGLRNIPVIMVTGVTGETGIDLDAFFKGDSSQDDGQAASKPEGFVEKPVDPQRLLKMIREVLH